MTNIPNMNPDIYINREPLIDGKQTSRNRNFSNKGCLYIFLLTIICIILPFISFSKKYEKQYIGSTKPVEDNDSSNIVYNAIIYNPSDDEFFEKASVLIEGTVHTRPLNSDYFEGKITIYDDVGIPKREITSKYIKLMRKNEIFYGTFTDSSDFGKGHVSLINITLHCNLDKIAIEINTHYHKLKNSETEVKDDRVLWLVAPASNKDEASELAIELYLQYYK